MAEITLNETGFFFRASFASDKAGKLSLSKQSLKTVLSQRGKMFYKFENII